MLPSPEPSPQDAAESTPPPRDTSGRFARGAGARRPRRTRVEIISQTPQAASGVRIIGRRPLTVRRSLP
jgi:hypothetical protein